MKINSTTNTITLLTFICTAIFMFIALVKGVPQIDPVISGFWGTLIGFVVGAKSNKNSTKQMGEVGKATAQATASGAALAVNAPSASSVEVTTGDELEVGFSDLESELGHILQGEEVHQAQIDE